MITVLLNTADQSSNLIVTFIVFLPQMPGGICQSSAEAQEQQPDQRIPVIAGLQRGRCNFYRSLGAVPMKDWTTYRLTGDTLLDVAK